MSNAVCELIAAAANVYFLRSSLPEDDVRILRKVRSLIMRTEYEMRDRAGPLSLRESEE